MTEAEAEALAAKARAARLSVGAYLRRRGLRRPVPDVQERRLAAEDRRELNRIGVNLNQDHAADALGASRLAPAPDDGRAGGAAGGDPLGRRRRVMVGSIAAGGGGFGGVAAYCLEEKLQQQEQQKQEEERQERERDQESREWLPEQGGGEADRERDETEILSGGREHAPEAHHWGPLPERGDDEEKKKKQEARERERKAEADRRLARRVEWTETRNLGTQRPLAGGADHGGDGGGCAGTQAALRGQGDREEAGEARLSLHLELGAGGAPQSGRDEPGRHWKPPGARPGQAPSPDRGPRGSPPRPRPRDREPGELGERQGGLAEPELFEALEVGGKLRAGAGA